METNLRILVAAYRCFPNFSATAVTLNNLLTQLNPEEFVLASQEFTSPGEPAADTGLAYPPPHFISKVARNTVITRRLACVKAVAMIPLIARKLEKLGRSTECRQILGVYPNIAFLGGAALAAERLGVPFFVWLHNTPKAMQWNRFYNDKLGLEKRILSKASCIFTMSDAMRDEYRAFWPNKRVETLPHPFTVNKCRLPEPDYNERPLRLLLSGDINASNADALGNIVRAIRGEPEKYEMHITGRASMGRLNRHFGDLGNMKCHGFVDENTLQSLQKKAHILLLPHGLNGALDNIEYRTIFPTKTVTYMMANRPIFAHVPEGSGIDQYLQKENLAYLEYSPEVDAIRKGLDKLASDVNLRSQLANNCVRALRRFDAARVAAYFREQVVGT
jgi:glycosyltransferase involved in cell wall biosynthesis